MGMGNLSSLKSSSSRGGEPTFRKGRWVPFSRPGVRKLTAIDFRGWRIEVSERSFGITLRRTTYSATLTSDYQRTYPELQTYVVMELEEHLPPYMIWLLHQFVDVDAVMRHWISSGRNWTLPDDGRNGSGGVHVFLASRPKSAIE